MIRGARQGGTLTLLTLVTLLWGDPSAVAQGAAAAPGDEVQPAVAWAAETGQEPEPEQEPGQEPELEPGPEQEQEPVPVRKAARTRFTLDFTETLVADLHLELQGAEDEGNIVGLRNRLNARLRYGAWALGMRLDSAWFAIRPTSERFADDPINVQELFVKRRFGGLSVGAGDEYVSFGRGMALSLRKLDELGFDITLRGAHVQWKSRSFSARAHVGLTNVTNVDGVDEKKVPDPLDLIAGVRLEARPLQSLLRGLRVGAHVVDVERRHSAALGTLSPIVPGGIDQSSGWSFGDKFIRSSIVGASLEAPRIARTVSLYAEANVLQNTNTRVSGGGDSSGLAMYGSATAFVGPVTLWAEAKHYENYDLRSTLHPETANATGSITKDFGYVAPPTLERRDQRWTNNTSVDGVHLQVDARLPERSGRVFLSGAGFQHGPLRDEITAHVYGGWESRWKGRNRVIAQAGWRMDRHPGDDQTRLRMFHLDLDAYLLVAAGHDLQIHWTHEFRSTDLELPDQRDDYLEGTSYVSWNIAPSWSVTAQLEYLTSKTEDRPLFPGGYLQYRFTKDSFVRIFAGRSKGGLKCSGGVCRVFPDFDGARLEATARF